MKTEKTETEKSRTKRPYVRRKNVKNTNGVKNANGKKNGNGVKNANGKKNGNGVKNTNGKVDAVDTLINLVEEINNMTPEQRDMVIFRFEEIAKNLKLGNDDAIDGFIFKTHDTNQFVNVEGNRLINEDSAYVRSLAESLQAIGNISPTIVNEQKQTIDGQRRMAAIKKYELSVPVRYTIVKGANIDTVGDLNRLQINWNYRDWMHKYVSLGKPDYKRYEEIEEKYKKYMRSRSLRSILMNNRVESFPSKIWEGGAFRVDKMTEQFNLQFLDFLGQVHEIGGDNNVFAKNRDFQKALYELYKQKNLNEKRMLNKIKTGFPKINVRVDSEEYKKILNELYNTRLKRENRVLVG